MSHMVAGHVCLELLDRGPRSTVYRGRRESDGTPVVVKVLAREGATVRDMGRYRFAHEVARGLDHPGLCRSLACVDDSGRPVLITEDIGGDSIRHRLAQGPLTLREGLAIATALADALSHLHDHGVVHRDVNPGNAIIDAHGRVQLIDFDLATRLVSCPADAVGPGRLEGTLRYIAPEQTGRMNRHVDCRADLYSLGVSLYEMLTGSVPFEGDDAMALVHAHLAQRPPRPEGLPDPVADIVMRLLEKSPEARYQSATGLRSDLQHCIDELDIGGEIAPFELCTHDLPARLQLSQRLYGREAQVASLAQAVQRVAAGGTELLLVAGYSGVGKSSLVREVHRPVVAARGRYAAGKFDPLVRTPFRGLVGAVRDLVADVLAAPADQVSALGARLRDSIGDDAPVLVELVPELAHLLGEQSAPTALPPDQARYRFLSAFQGLLRAFASDRGPLVIFLDDLQWADVGTLALIEQLVSGDRGSGLLILGAYRDNEVDQDHGLMRTVAALTAAGSPVTTLSLTPLSRDSVGEWIQDSLGRPAADLARAVHARTNGNPFFVARMLQGLSEDGGLTYDPQTRRWDWDLASVEALGVAENVAELMAARLARLDPTTLATLEVAACIGNRVDLMTLSNVLDQTPEDVVQRLWPALGASLLVPIGDAWRFAGLGGPDASEVEYRFVHDKVQEAAHAAIPQARRAQVHLDIGRRLIALLTPTPDARALFAAVDQIVAGGAAVPEGEERLALARLLHTAGSRALDAVAPEGARRYLQAGLALMPADAADDLTVQLRGALARAAEGCGDDPAALEVLDKLVATTGGLQQVAALSHQANIYARIGKHLDTFEVGIRALRLLGQSVPDSPEDWQARGQVEAQLLDQALDGRDVDDILALPDLTDPQLCAITDLLTVMSPGVWANPHTIPVINPWLARTLVTHGHTASAPVAYASFAMQLSAFGHYDRADQFARLASQLADQRGDRGARPAPGFVTMAWTSHWRHPLSQGIEAGRRGIAAALETGAGHSWAAWTAMILPGMFLAGETPLAEAIDETQRMVRLAARRLHVEDAVVICSGGLLPMYRLTGRHDEFTAQLAEGLSEDVVHQRLEHYPMIRGPLYTWRMIADVILGETEAAERAVDQAAPTVVLGPGLVSFLEWRFFSCLARMDAAAVHPGDDDRANAAHALLEESLPMLDAWAAGNPAVHGCKPLLLRAVAASSAGRPDADALFTQAITAAEAGDVVRDQAMCLERAGRHWLARGDERRARGYLADARFCWVRWGAQAKVTQLETQLPQLAVARQDGTRSRTSVTSTSTGGDLDARTLLKATRAISTCILLDELIDTVLAAVLENAGARRAVLLTPSGDDFETTASASVPGAVGDGVAWSVVRFVARTGRRVVLGDIRQHSRYAGDSHVVEGAVRSVLCQPIHRQGELAAVLYVENELLADAFTPRRCEVLDVLAAQAAISLQNARMFEEQREQTEAMARFLPSEFIALLGHETVTDIRLGDATEQEMTVLFSDIRGFTTRSEAMRPEETFRFLNAYLRHVGPVIRAHGGFIDKYLGDGVMALFPGEPLHAVRAGIGLLGAAQAFNAELAATGGAPIEIGVGIHRGRLMLGTIGEPQRMDGTVVSDTVNTAARLEEMTKELAAPLVVSQAVLQGEARELPHRYLGPLDVRGRREGIDAYEVLGEVSDVRLGTREGFETGARALAAGRKGEAAAALAGVVAQDPGDKSARRLLRLALDEG